MVEWADIEAEVANRLRLARLDYEDAQDHDDMVRLQGRIRAFKEVLGMPSYMRAVVALDEEEKGAMKSG